MSVRARSIAAAVVGALVVGMVPALAESAGASKPAAAGAESFPVASEIRLAGDGNQTRFVVDLTRKIELRAFTLANPYRVVVDVPQVTFQLPAKAGEGGRGLIKAFRFGLVMRGGSRFVLDLAKPARIEKAFVLEAENNQPARLVLDLVAVDRETFLRTIALENRAPDPPARRAEPDPSAKSPGDSRPLIVIDPGHGGIDNGTSAANGQTEKAIVLEFGLLLRDQLEKTGKYRVAMTRSDDTFVPLAERVQFARSRQAALLISVHADALARGDGAAQGATVYTLSETASDAEAGRLAEAENRADVIAGVNLAAEPNDVADILIDLAQRETKSFSMQFAHSLISEMRNATRLHKHPLKSAGFRVLRAPDVPSVLLELGYVSSAKDLKSLTSEAWRTRAASAVAQAVDRYFSTRFAGTRRSAGPN